MLDDPELAGGFRWTCCGELGDDPGCVKGKHKGTRGELLEMDAESEDEDDEDSEEVDEEYDGYEHAPKRGRFEGHDGDGVPLWASESGVRIGPMTPAGVIELSDGDDEERWDDEDKENEDGNESENDYDEEEDDDDDEEDESGPQYSQSGFSNLAAYRDCIACGKQYYDDGNGGVRDCYTHDRGTFLIFITVMNINADLCRIDDTRWLSSSQSRSSKKSGMVLLGML